MSFIGRMIEGERIPVSDSGLSRPATDFNGRVAPIHTGKAESQWLGRLLLAMASEGGGLWHKVPWRMLRNRFLKYDRSQRLLYCLDKTPRHIAEEPPVTWVMGGGIPSETVHIGVTDMIRQELVAVTTDKDGETYLFPTEKLLACVVRLDRW